MKKFADWFEKHHNEVGFAGIMAFIVVMLCYGANSDTVNGAVYDTFGLILLSVVFCLGVVLLGQSAFSSRRVADLKLFTACLFLLIIGWMIVYSCRLQQAFAATDAIKLGCCGAVCATVCGWYLDWRKCKLERLEFLQDSRPDEYLRELIKNKRVLNGEQQLKIFYLGDAEKLLFEYMQYEDLSEAAEIRLLEAPFALKLIKHLPRYSFKDAADARLFAVDNAPELVLQYVENGNVFSSQNELKMFDLPNADEVVGAYICNASLSDEAEMLMLELPNAKDLLEFYDDEYELCEAAREKAQEKGLI